MLNVKSITDQVAWDHFVTTLKPDTFLHTWAWGEFQSHAIERVGAYDGETLVGVALFIFTPARRGAFVLCPHGPLTLPNRADAETVLLEEAIKLGKARGYDFIRVAPLSTNTPEHTAQYQRLGFRRAPIHAHPELSWVLTLAPDEETLLKNMRKTARYSIKKAQKDGVTIKVSTDPADIAVFQKLYADTVARQGFQPFSVDYLQREFATFQQWDMMRIFLAYEQGQPVSGAMIVFTPYAAFYHQGASSHVNPKSTASYLLQWEVIKLAKARGCEVYNFWGISPEDKPKHPWAGLSLFKKGFGGEAHAYVPTQDKPLTTKYWLNLLIETIRRKRRGY